MAKKFSSGELRGVSEYLRQRSRSVKKPHKRIKLEVAADTCVEGADYIDKLEAKLKRKR